MGRLAQAALIFLNSNAHLAEAVVHSVVNGVPRAPSVALPIFSPGTAAGLRRPAGVAPGRLSETQDSGIGRIYFPESQPARAQG